MCLILLFWQEIYRFIAYNSYESWQTQTQQTETLYEYILKPTGLQM
jgi:hypothetical protein